MLILNVPLTIQKLPAISAGETIGTSSFLKVGMLNYRALLKPDN